MTIYSCINKRCREYHKEFSAMDIDDAKVAIGRGVTCNGCGRIVRFIRRDKQVKDNTREDG